MILQKCDVYVFNFLICKFYDFSLYTVCIYILCLIDFYILTVHILLLIKGLVEKQQKLNQSPFGNIFEIKIYNIKIPAKLNNDGTVMNTNCECPVGLGPHGTCKHLAARLLSFADIVKNGCLNGINERAPTDFKISIDLL